VAIAHQAPCTGWPLPSTRCAPVDLPKIDNVLDALTAERRQAEMLRCAEADAGMR